MKNLTCSLLFILVMWMSYGHAASPPPRWGCSPPPEWLITSIPIVLQPDGLPWCSITSSQMAYASHKGKDDRFEQCRLVTTVLQDGSTSHTPLPPDQSCCPPEITSQYPFTCQSAFWPENVFRLAAPYRMKYVEVYPETATDPPALPWEDIMDQIFCKGLPFIFIWKDSDGMPVHTAIAIGYEETPEGKRFVKVHDPLTGYTRLSYEKGFVQPLWLPGGGHFEDYVDLFLE